MLLLWDFLICKLKGWHCHTSQFCATCSNHLNETVGYILTSDVDKNHRILELEKKLSIYSNSLIVKLEKLKQILFEYSVFSFKYFIIFYGKTYQLNGNYPWKYIFDVLWHLASSFSTLDGHFFPPNLPLLCHHYWILGGYKNFRGTWLEVFPGRLLKGKKSYIISIELLTL